MKKVVIDKNFGFGFIMVFGILAIFSGLISLVTGDPAGQAGTMLVLGVVIVIASFIPMFGKAGRSPGKKIWALASKVSAFRHTQLPYTVADPQQKKQMEELYRAVYKVFPSFSVLPQLRQQYGEENLRKLVASPQTALILFQRNQSRELLAYIYQVSKDSACFICLNMAQSLSRL